MKFGGDIVFKRFLSMFKFPEIQLSDSRLRA